MAKLIIKFDFTKQKVQNIIHLSRRALFFEMQGLSFREYLRMFEGIEMPLLTIDEINDNKIDHIWDFHPLPFLRKYMGSSYYPFSNLPRFDRRMQQILSETIEVDISTYKRSDL